MNPQLPTIQVPSYGKYHYFFYGMATEDQLSPLIATAEKYGCEYLNVVPMQIQVQASRLALAGKPQAQLVTVYRIFVRCPREQFASIKEMMEADAKKEQAEGFKP